MKLPDRWEQTCLPPDNQPGHFKCPGSISSWHAFGPFFGLFNKSRFLILFLSYKNGNPPPHFPFWLPMPMGLDQRPRQGSPKILAGGTPLLFFPSCLRRWQISPSTFRRLTVVCCCAATGNQKKREKIKWHGRGRQMIADWRGNSNCKEGVGTHFGDTCNSTHPLKKANFSFHTYGRLLQWYCS